MTRTLWIIVVVASWITTVANIIDLLGSAP